MQKIFSVRALYNEKAIDKALRYCYNKRTRQKPNFIKKGRIDL